MVGKGEAIEHGHPQRIALVSHLLPLHPLSLRHLLGVLVP